MTCSSVLLDRCFCCCSIMRPETEQIKQRPLVACSERPRGACCRLCSGSINIKRKHVILSIFLLWRVAFGHQESVNKYMSCKDFLYYSCYFDCNNVFRL